jgi:thiol-disulfide isomerase/thioredoxin
MMKIFLAVLVLAIMAGCVAEQPPEPTSVAVETTSAQNGTTAATAPPPQQISPPVENNTTGVMTSETVFPPEPVFDFNYTDGNGTLRVFFFHSPGCSACRDSYPIMGELEDEFPGVIFINYSLATENGSKAYVRFAELHNLSTQKQMVPQVLVNGTIITDRFNIEEELGPLLENLTKGAS